MYIAPMVEVLAPPSIASILGTDISTSLTSSLNAEMSAQVGNVVFGSSTDPHAEMYNHFITNVGMPLIETERQVQHNIKIVENRDKIRTISSKKELKRGIPVDMQMPILTYKPVKQLLKDKKIDAFGYTYAQLPSKDVVGRLIRNGRVTCHPDDNNRKMMSWTWHSDDPEYTRDELDDISRTREYIGDFLADPKNKDIDITNYPNAMLDNKDEDE